MKPRLLTDVIVALATPAGRGALAVIRVSGPGSVDLVGGVFRGRRPLADLPGYSGAFGRLADASGDIDEAVAWVYRSPHSYTGEDMVEISAHGGSVSARRILGALQSAGARPADPGEFTRRAFLNGKLDLTQAEAVADVIAAEGARAHRAALTQLSGGLRRRIEDIAGQVRDTLVQLEAHLDFGEDVPEAPHEAALGATISTALAGMESLLATLRPMHALRAGYTVVLAGEPNVGKSSLLNRLSGMDRSIVHDEPGTTRDAVDVRVEWSGLPVRLVDTAGIRDSGHRVESAGIARSREEMQAADLVLWVVDSREPTPPPAGSLALVNKSDLGGPPEWFVNDHSPLAIVSARTGDGLSTLVESVTDMLMASGPSLEEPDSVLLSNERQAGHLESARSALIRARDIVTDRRPVELAAADLHRCLESLAEITGDNPSEEILDRIFSRFCIGK